MNQVLEPFVLTEEEVEALYEYFYKHAGYVSYEFCPLVIVLIQKLMERVSTHQ